MEMQLFRKQNLSDVVKASLYEYIDNMDLSRGTKLPPENEIAKNYGVSRITIRRALDELEQEGVIIRIHGRGTFVNPQAKQFKINMCVSQELSELLGKSGYDIRICLKDYRKEPCDMTVGKALSIPTGSSVLIIEKAYYANGHLAIVCIDSIADALFEQTPSREEFEFYSSYEVLRRLAGRLALRDWMQIRTIPASELNTRSGIGREFNCPTLLKFYGSVYDGNNDPIIYGSSYYDTEYVHFNLVRNIVAY